MHLSLLLWLYDTCSIPSSLQCIELTSYSLHGSVVERIGLQTLQELAGEQYLSWNTQEGSFHVSGCWKGVEEFRSAVRLVLTDLASQSAFGAADQMPIPQDSLSSLISQVSQGRETQRLRLTGGPSPHVALPATQLTPQLQTTLPDVVAAPVVTTVISPSTRPKVQTTESLVTTEQAPRPSTTSAPTSSLTHKPTAPPSTEGRYEAIRVAPPVTSASKQPLKAKHNDPLASTKKKGDVKDDSVTQERHWQFPRPRERSHSVPLGTVERPNGTVFPSTTPLDLTSGKPRDASSMNDLLAQYPDLPSSHPSVRTTSGAGTLDIGRRVGARDTILGFADVSTEPVMDDIGDLDRSTLQLMKKLGKCQMTGITLNCDIGSVTLTAATEEGLERMRNAFLMEYSEINPPKGKEIQYNLLDDTDILQSHAAEAEQKYKQCAFWIDKRARVIHIASRSETELDAAYKQLISQVIAHQVDRAAFFGQTYDSGLPATTLASERTSSILTSSTAADTVTAPNLFTIVGLHPTPPTASSAPPQGLSIFEAAQIQGNDTEAKPAPLGVVQPRVDASKLNLSSASPASVELSPRKRATSPTDRHSRDGNTRSASQVDSMALGEQKVVLQLSKGNIAQEDVDVIVNAANSNLRHLGGVARDLNEASEGVLQVLSDDYVQTKGAVPTGDVAVTPAGGHLKCKHVFHAVGPKASEYSKVDCEKLLKEVCCKALQAAERLGITTIAFPAISSGIFGVGVDIISRMLVKTLSEYHYSPDTSLHEVRIVILHDDILESFQAYFRRKKHHLMKKGRGVSPGRPPIRPDGGDATSSVANKVDSRKMADLAVRSSRELYLQSGGGTGRPEQRKKSPTTHEQKWRY